MRPRDIDIEAINLLQRHIFDSMRDALIVVDGDLRIVRLNRAALRFLGDLEKPDASSYLRFIGSKLDEVCPVCSTCHQCFPRLALAHDAPASNELHLDDRFYEETWERVVGEPNPGYNLVVFRDVTQKKQDEEEKEALMRRLSNAQKMEALGNMASSLAHEINNPIGIIIGFAECLQDAIAGGQLLENVNLIYDEALRIKEIVERMLDLAHPRDVPMESIPLGQVLSDTLALMSPKLAKRRISCRYDPPPRHVEVRGSSNSLMQVFLNLLLNAQEALPDDGTGEITVSCHTSGASVDVRIRDNGEGIEAANLERVFEPFFTSKPKGTGLGLAISSAILEKHDASISLKSKRGVGTTVIVRFPAA